MRKGKMVAQGAHASIAFLCDYGKHVVGTNTGSGMQWHNMAPLDDAMVAWIRSGFTKICVGVDSHLELLEVYNNALDAGVQAVIITDKGLTEFGGEATQTCVAVGPAWADEVDKITGELKLL